ISEKAVRLKPLQEETVPEKLPVTLIVALPRPKVLRRLIMDSVTLGIEKIILLHSYRVDKSYWQTPFLQQLNHYIELGLEQAGATVHPRIAVWPPVQPLPEAILPAGTKRRPPADVAQHHARHGMAFAIERSCSVGIGPDGG